MINKEDNGEILAKVKRELSGEPEEMPETTKKPVSKYNLKMPPGLCGEVTKYINSQCRYPLEHLAAISAIVAVGNIGGLYYELDDSGTTTNLMVCCVAGSSCGKEAVLQAFAELHIMAGVSGAMHGSIKSEQEIIRNLIRHQAVFYNIDEFGYFLKKLKQSQKSGGASYLQGVISQILSIYSKANGYLLLTGDLKEEIRKDLKQKYGSINNEIEKEKELVKSDLLPQMEIALKLVKYQLDNIDKGLRHPFLSLIGFSTPSTFNESVSPEHMDDGLIGRSIIVDEKNTNPRAKKDFKRSAMPEELRYAIYGLCQTGEYSVNSRNERIEEKDPKTVITTTPEAKQLLSDAYEWIYDDAERHVENMGFQAVVRRGYEMIEKVSFILAMGSDTRGVVEVEWATEYIKEDLYNKTLLAYSNQKEVLAPVNAIMAKILRDIGEEGKTIGELCNKYNRISERKKLVNEAVNILIDRGRIYKKKTVNKYNKKESIRIFKL